MNKKIIETVNLNKSLFINKLSVLNFGNGSAIDRKKNIIYIKASGITPEKVSSKNIVGVKFEKNNSYKIVFNKNLNPSVDINMHIRIYNQYKKINSIIHNHSCFATILSQIKVEPKCIGTTHADFFNKSLPLSEAFKLKNNKEYDDKIFLSIKKRLDREKHFPPGILLRSHGVLSWGENIKTTIENSVAIEFICKLYYYSHLINKNIILDNSLIKFHYERKNGKNKRYGQFQK